MTFTGDAATGWTTIGTLDYQSAGGALFNLPSYRHRYQFDAVQATGMRLIVPNATGLGNGTVIDELEFYTSAANHTLNPGQSVVVDEGVSMSPPFTLAGASITEPGGDGNYRYVAPGASMYISPLVKGENVKVEMSWVANSNHATDVDVYFDPDGTGPLAEFLLASGIDQRELADQSTLGSIAWSDFYTLSESLDLSPESFFRLEGSGGAVTSAAWRFTAATIPEPATIVLWCGIFTAMIAAAPLMRRKR